MDSSRRDLPNDMADEQKPILENNQNTTPVLVSHPKQVYSIPQNVRQVFCFHC